jgi:hypothetical protein
MKLLSVAVDKWITGCSDLVDFNGISSTRLGIYYDKTVG